MKRAPIVLISTAAGLAAVLGYHTTASSGTMGATGGLGTTSGTAPVGDTSAAGSRTVVGLTSQDIWGTLAVSVTQSGSRIGKVGIASMNDLGNPISVAIDQRAIPTLEQEAVAAQSANINTVSGATYTSKAFIGSLQSALGKLGMGGSGGSTPSTTTAPPTTSPTTTAPAPPPTTTPTSKTVPPTTAPPAPPTTAAANRTVVGQTATDMFGTLAVSVTDSGGRITNVTLASSNNNGNTISDAIDQRAIPTLEQEALAAQSANINTVSGATYTSKKFISSLQSALTQLGL